MRVIMFVIGMMLIVMLVGVIFGGVKIFSIGGIVPKMQLEYTVDGKTEKMSVNHGTASWQTIYGGIQSDSLHPLDAVGVIPEIKKIDGLKEIKINFSSKPTSYSVRCWEDRYIKKTEAYEKYYEVMTISDDTFSVPVDNKGYIYEVHATWPQGDVCYAFYITNSN